MKKFLSVFMLAIFASVALQFSAMKTARAEYLVYCFSDDNLGYYVDLDTIAIGTNMLGVEGVEVEIHVKGYSPAMNSVVTLAVSKISFFPPDWYICVFTLNGGYKQGRISQSWKAMAVYTILTNPNTIRSYEQYKREVEAQQRREEEAREREKQRLAEQKRREEEARKNKFDLLIAAGDQAYTAKDYLVAAQSYESARKLDKSTVDKFVEELVKNGDNLLSQVNFSAALDYYKKAVVMNLDNASNQGKLFFPRLLWENFSEAANFYRTMTTIRPDYFHYWYMLGWMLDELKDYDGAIAAYTRSAELNPTEIIYKYRGDAYKILGRYDEAIADYKKSLELRPDYKYALDELWDVYCKSGKFDDAADFYNKRVTTQIDYSDSWFRLAWSLNEQKKFPEAIKAMHSFIDCFSPDSSSANGWYWLARVYQNAGDTKKAVDACKTALNLDPEHDDAKKLLAQLSGGK